MILIYRFIVLFIFFSYIRATRPKKYTPVRTKIFILALSIMVATSCRKPEYENPRDLQYDDRLSAMEQLVNIGVDYDVTAVDELFVEGEDYWQLDAVLGYNDDYTKVESVHRDFANMEGRDDDDLIFAFYKTGVVNCRDIYSADGTIVEQHGSWSYNARTLELAISVPEFGDNIAMEFKTVLLSLTPESAVLEWRADDGEALRASLRPASYQKHQERSANIIATNIMSECSNYDTENIEQGVAGEWRLYCDFAYDDQWQRVDSAYVIFGVHYVAGASYPQYVFNDDGTGSYSQNSILPPFEPIVVTFKWNYNEENSCLELNCEESVKTYFVSGYCDEYIIFDINGNSPTSKNHRLVYKRVS